MLKFKHDDNNIKNTKLAKYENCGYCVINALTNLTKANGLNFNLETMQQRVKYLVNWVMNDFTLFKNLMTDFYKDNAKISKKIKSFNDEAWEHNYDLWKKCYIHNIECMNGNQDSIVWLVLKNLGYKIKWINKQLHSADIENLGKIYGNFGISLSGHMSCFANGEITDFYNPFIKKIGTYRDSGYSEQILEKRKKVDFIVYK